MEVPVEREGLKKQDKIMIVSESPLESQTEGKESGATKRNNLKTKGIEKMLLGYKSLEVILLTVLSLGQL